MELFKFDWLELFHHFGWLKSESNQFCQFTLFISHITTSMSFKRQRTQSKTAKCLLEYDDKYYVAVSKKGLLFAIRGKGERWDRSA